MLVMIWCGKLFFFVVIKGLKNCYVDMNILVVIGIGAVYLYFLFFIFFLIFFIR